MLNSFQDERDLQASLLDPPDKCLGRRELMLSDLVTLKGNLQDSIESEDFLRKIQIRYSEHSAWTNIYIRNQVKDKGTNGTMNLMHS